MTAAPSRLLNDSAKTQRRQVSASTFASRAMPQTFSMLVVVPVFIASIMAVSDISTRSSGNSSLFGDTGGVRLFWRPKVRLSPRSIAAERCAW